MSDSLTLSRGRLETFLVCQRRFQLRYLERLPWPLAPFEPGQTAAMQAGEQFHQLIQRHILGLPIPDEVLNQYDHHLRHWWRAFLERGPHLVAADRPLVEMTLTVPIGNHALLGRFDLIAVGEGVRIFDWKTGSPRSEAELREDWQTRLYLALAAEGCVALGRPNLQPEEISITYWYARQPAQSVTISYSAAEHEQNWRDLMTLVESIDTKVTDPTAWSLTEDLTVCVECPYSNFCGRFDLPNLINELMTDDRNTWDEEAQWAWEPEAA